MSPSTASRVPFDPWRDFVSLTAARIALGRAGGSIPTRELLDFGLAHARARDAVRRPFEAEALRTQLAAAGCETLLIESRARTRDEYLRRPDLGRRLSDESRRAVSALAERQAACDLCVVVSDGLSAQATHHAPAVVAPLFARLRTDGWRIAPVLIARCGRVALQDEIGSLLEASLALMLLGERPGLGSPDSLGAYFVFQPGLGKSDADRNCVSNIRPDGLPPEAAVDTLLHLLRQSRHLKLSGVGLKDERTLPPSSSMTGRALAEV